MKLNGSVHKVIHPLLAREDAGFVRVGLGLSWPNTVRAMMAVFGAHVGHVFPMGAEKEMVDTNARGIIAMMTNEQSFGNWTICQLPRYPMCQELAPVPSTLTANDSIPTKGCSSDPDLAPVVICPLDMFGKSLKQGDCSCLVGVIVRAELAMPLLLDIARLTRKGAAAILTGARDLSKTGSMHTVGGTVEGATGTNLVGARAELRTTVGTDRINGHRLNLQMVPTPGRWRVAGVPF